MSETTKKSGFNHGQRVVVLPATVTGFQRKATIDSFGNNRYLVRFDEGGMEEWVPAFRIMAS